MFNPKLELSDINEKAIYVNGFKVEYHPDKANGLILKTLYSPTFIVFDKNLDVMSEQERFQFMAQQGYEFLKKLTENYIRDVADLGYKVKHTNDGGEF